MTCEGKVNNQYYHFHGLLWLHDEAVLMCCHLWKGYWWFKIGNLKSSLGFRLHGCEFINPTYTWATPHLKTTITAAAITTYHYLMKNKLKLFSLPTETQYSLCGKLKFFLEIRYKSNWCITKGIFFISHMSKKERNKITGTFLIVTSSYITFDCFRDVNASFWTI